MGGVLCTSQGGRKTSLLKCDFFSSEQLSSPPTDYIQMISSIFVQFSCSYEMRVGGWGCMLVGWDGVGSLPRWNVARRENFGSLAPQATFFGQLVAWGRRLYITPECRAVYMYIVHLHFWQPLYSTPWFTEAYLCLYTTFIYINQIVWSSTVAWLEMRFVFVSFD